MPDRDESERHPSLLAMRPVAAIVVAACVGAFAVYFDPNKVQWGVDALWLSAILLWVVECRRLNHGRLSPFSPTRADILPIAGLIAVFAACWLPFYDNWRWAYTGDSIAWYALAADSARDGLLRNLLSAFGVDGHFTYLHSLASNTLLFVFEPSLYWHRVGKLVVSCLSLAAIYAFFNVTLGRGWALLITACTAANFVWIWFSYVSYGHIDSHIFYFLSLLGAVYIWRRPDDLAGWVLAGLIGGCSLFFTQTAWSAVAAVGIVAGIFALATGRFGHAFIYGISFLLVAVPILLQLDMLLRMTTKQAATVLDAEYVSRIARTILELPYRSPYFQAGVGGPLLRAPLGQSYVVGAAIAAIGFIPVLRRRLRIPAVGPALLLLLLWDTALLTLTNNNYGVPSRNRIYSLIPLQIFLAILPAIVAAQWVARWSILRTFVVASVIGGAGYYGAGSLRVILEPAPGLYGTNVYDGLIELRQRFGDRRPVLYTSREIAGWMVAFLDAAYLVGERVEIRRGFEARPDESDCGRPSMFCYEPAIDEDAFVAMTAAIAKRIVEVPLLNTKEMRCFECATPAP